MLGLFNKKKKKNVIAERIRALENKLWLIQMTGKEYNVDNIIRYDKVTSVGISESYRTIRLDTAFGERILAVNSNSLYYGDSDLIKYNKEGNEQGWSFDFNFIFSIKLKDEDKVEVRFHADTIMSKEMVDLAILEFEEYIDSIYKGLVERQCSYEDLINYLKEGC